ncbi:Isochorismatase [Sphingopyxis sp. Root214]|uniref:cysteine hydrolase family protein n=1 Tax=unclassified Sphingopyxis TaxID=2614943 RepID=UPI0006F3A866|nr:MULTISPECIES: cysteine hydrolase family protein [unclassified Sphingopyxis]KQZ76711.1 Isochorismatase [Sphingopyxis sp. Root154]KRC09402.1 Isochorismatase [Sphingopyxis sp. Root214]
MSKRAIIVVDIQNEYFAEGKFPLVGIENAAANAAKVITAARQKGDLVVHIQHEMPMPDAPIFVRGSDGVQINDTVKPAEDEAVIVKNFPNAFRGTPLKQTLDDNGVEEVVVVGAMSHMCIDATVRAANDLGYRTTTIHDACATRDLEFGGTITPATQVHAALMAALAFYYGEVIDTATWIER